MAKFLKIEVAGEYRFQAQNEKSRKLAVKFGCDGLVNIRTLLLITTEAKGKVIMV